MFLKNKLKQLYCVFSFALHCAGHFVVDESNPDPYKSGTLMLGTLRTLETWSARKMVIIGNVEVWKVWTGTLEPLELPSHLQPCPGKLQRWNLGTQNFGTLGDDIAALEPRRACCWVAKLG